MKDMDHKQRAAIISELARKEVRVYPRYLANENGWKMIVEEQGHIVKTGKLKLKEGLTLTVADCIEHWNSALAWAHKQYKNVEE